ncbi:MAG: hypothetical protein MOB07_22490 [Acidobacteria bacterium]|nr:hypothetical protein [Acidobacteriota bacterium]
MEIVTEEKAFCIECLENASDHLSSYDGHILCRQCAVLYYIVCGMCGLVVPREEAAIREGNSYCPECFAKPIDGSLACRLDEAELAALIADYARLHAEEKIVKDKLEEIKEKLKRHAATQLRISNAVLLRAGEHSVKCGYSARVSYDPKKLELVESMLGAERFDVLFQREVKFSPVKENLDRFLEDDSVEYAEARDAIQSSIEFKEIVTITPYTPGKNTKKSPKN